MTLTIEQQADGLIATYINLSNEIKGVEATQKNVKDELKRILTIAGLDDIHTEAGRAYTSSIGESTSVDTVAMLKSALNDSELHDKIRPFMKQKATGGIFTIVARKVKG